MSEKSDPQKMEALLARVMERQEEKDAPLKSEARAPGRTIEVDKILLRDAAGKYRGKISANADGSASLLLSDDQGKAWAWLGVNQEGEAFLELKDQKGEISYKVPVTPLAASPGGTEAATPVQPSPQSAPPPPLDAAALAQLHGQPEVAEAAPAARPRVAPPPAPEFPDWQSGRQLDPTVGERLQKLERQHRRRWFFRGALLGLLALVMAIQVFLLTRPPAPPGPLEAQSLTMRDPNGTLRAWLGEKDGRLALELRDPKGQLRAALQLGAEGSPALGLYDQAQKVRAELALGPDGDAKLRLMDNSSMQGKTEQNTPNDTNNQESAIPNVIGDDGGTISPAASQPEAMNQSPGPEAGTVFVGSKTSNKYHLPDCKWAKTIRADRLITFKSAADAQAQHYIPCPVCKPPPLGH
jgi:hypothetical protein